MLNGTSFFYPVCLLGFGDQVVDKGSYYATVALYYLWLDLR